MADSEVLTSVLKEFGAKAGETASNKYQIQLKNCCHENPAAATVGVDQHRCFPVNVAKLLRTPILKMVRERLLLKISTSVANLPMGGNS